MDYFFDHALLFTHVSRQEVSSPLAERRKGKKRGKNNQQVHRFRFEAGIKMGRQMEIRSIAERSATKRNFVSRVLASSVNEIRLRGGTSPRRQPDLAAIWTAQWDIIETFHAR